MSLRFRLNLLISLLFVLVFFSSGAYVVLNARDAVSEEMQSTSYLALQLVDLVLAGADQRDREDLQEYMVEKFSRLESTRHLQVVVAVRGSMDQAVPPVVVAPVRSTAPSWFVRLVKPVAMEYRRVFAEPDFPFIEVLVRADPSDEINEVWSETRIVLLSLLLYIVMANALVYIILGRDLAPIESILQGLDRIEKGDYRLRLPRFRVAELSRISEKFNHMAEVMQRGREDNRLLTRKSIEIQEMERRRLARELHDELGQSLNAIKAIAVTMGGEAGREAGYAETIARIAERTYDSARNMMQRLRPPVLDELGLGKALQALVDAWNASHPDTFCNLECPTRIEELDGDTSINLYRIVQEALTNIDRHARAGSITVRLLQCAGPASGEQMSLEIHDDGQGFDASVRRMGLGLIGMRERAEAMNGEFSLQTSPGHGVRIRVEVPARAVHGPAQEEQT
ncbi:MAG: methanol utilization protein MoxY [Gammaproteobacteria bacterium]|nr:methanol utilization protein MoxY [Gammaproteobacteria bacterium]